MLSREVPLRHPARDPAIIVINKQGLRRKASPLVKGRPVTLQEKASRAAKKAVKTQS